MIRGEEHQKPGIGCALWLQQRWDGLNFFPWYKNHSDRFVNGPVFYHLSLVRHQLCRQSHAWLGSWGHFYLWCHCCLVPNWKRPPHPLLTQFIESKMRGRRGCNKHTINYMKYSETTSRYCPNYASYSLLTGNKRQRLFIIWHCEKGGKRHVRTLA